MVCQERALAWHLTSAELAAGLRHQHSVASIRLRVIAWSCLVSVLTIASSKGGPGKTTVACCWPAGLRRTASRS
jgi:hypothetical protein